VDGETAGDSEHLESFQKFCGGQDSEGGEEETPPTSNTEESAYQQSFLWLLFWHFNADPRF
jgi:hypothetical protein